MMKEKTYYLDCNISNDSEILLTAKNFGAIGIEEYSLNEEEVDRILKEKSYCGGEIPEEVFELIESSQASSKVKVYFDNSEDLKAFSSELANADIEFNQGEFENIDWNQNWRKFYKKLNINSKLEITPSWEKASFEPNIFIYPGLGFGTGHHETTKMCLEFMTELDLEKKLSVCDFGCGSGILGTATKKLCPEAVVDYYDIDLDALDNTKYNCELNSSEINQLLSPKDKACLGVYDLVFANILLDALLIERDFIGKMIKPGGYLIVSGLLRDQLSEIVSSYQSNIDDLTFISSKSDNDWCAGLFQKKS